MLLSDVQVFSGRPNFGYQLVYEHDTCDTDDCGRYRGRDDGELIAAGRLYGSQIVRFQDRTQNEPENN